MFFTYDVQNKQKGNDYTSEGSTCQGIKRNFVKEQKDHKGSVQENKIKNKEIKKSIIELSNKGGEKELGQHICFS